MSNVIILSFSIIFFFNPVSAAAESEDILKKILSEVGFTRDDLGYNPKGYWNRFPLDIPYRLTSFNDLYSEPLKLYDYALVMSHSVELYMEPSYSDSAMDGLYKLVYNLGVDKRLGGFRSYSANLRPPPEGENKILKAVESLYLMAGEELEHYTFGSKYEQPNGKNEIIEKTSNLIDSAKTIIAELILNLGDAIKWRNLAFRNCDYQKMQKVQGKK